MKMTADKLNEEILFYKHMKGALRAGGRRKASYVKLGQCTGNHMMFQELLVRTASMWRTSLPAIKGNNVGGFVC